MKTRTTFVTSLLLTAVLIARPSQARQTNPWTYLGPQPVGFQTPTLGEGYGLVGPRPIVGRVSSVAVADAKTVYIGTSGGGVWKTTDGGVNWKPKTDSQPSLTIGALALDPTNKNVIYAGTGEFINYYDAYAGVGVLRSVDAGETWTLLPDPNGVFVGAKVSRVAVDAGNPQNIYAATNRGLIISADGGQSWLSYKMGGCSQITDVVVDHNTTPSTVYAASSPNDNDWYVTDTPYSPACNGVWKSDPPANGPPTFSKLTPGVPAGNMIHLAIQNDQDERKAAAGESRRITLLKNARVTLYVAMQVYIPGSPAGGHQFDLKVYKSTDGGNRWEYVAMVCPGNWTCDGIWVQGMASEGKSTNAIFVLSQELFVSTDSGQRWSFGSFTEADPAQANPSTADPAKIHQYMGRKTHYDLHGFGFVPGDARKFFMGTDGGMYKSEDYGQTFTNLNQTLGNVHFYRGAVSNEASPALIGCMHDNGFVRSIGLVAGPRNWMRVSDGDGGGVVWDPQDAKRVYISRSDGALVRRSTDGGLSFQDAGPTLRAGESSDFLPPLVIDPKNHKRLLVATDIIYESLDGADTWHILKSGIVSFLPHAGGTPMTAIALAPSSSAVYASRGTQILKYTGATWNNVTYDIGNYYRVRALAVDPNNPDTVYAGLWAAPGTKRVRKLVGNSWVDASTNLPDANVNSIVINPGNSKDIFAATDKGVYRSTTAGAYWYLISTGMPNAIAYDVVLDQAGTMVYVFTHGRGVWRAALKDFLPASLRRHS